MGPSVNAISEHHYQTNVDATTSPAAFWPSYATQLTTKSNIRGNLSRFSASVLDAQKSGISFVLGETNTFFGHGQPGVSNSAAAALWLVDYSLQAASIGVDCVYFHQGIGYNYSAFEPLNNIGINVTDYEASAKRHVLPEYYGMLAVADTIGTSGNAFINELWTDNSNLAAYQIWEGDQSKRLMLINEVPWTAV
ncbi:hypothetical protein LTR78_009710 [Recurvomyces mirabilis]|uniref:Glycoside hydrolase family 79 protein n=1 Tax=Recurvomyces mirabilis TaxID=574656 RepID=A0AAE0TNF8_9PEZI|nr:hypothetical protein LTR78_009710 [Recurvomyces mirabilis]KAK5150248.1 hypothetical protein LTS14_010224 [Recurvomyces mirabilis]